MRKIVFQYTQPKIWIASRLRKFNTAINICLVVLSGIISTPLYSQIYNQTENLDYGDLPKVRFEGGIAYGTASHLNGTGDLFMGAMVDYESTIALDDDYSAMADNNDLTEDEDALLTVSGSSEANILLSIDKDCVIFRLNIACTNKTGADATLGAWIDLNCDELFDPTEYASATVPSTHPDGEDIELQWGSATNTTGLIGYDDIENIALRLRLAPSLNDVDYNDVANSNQPQSNGEVEDYWLPVSCICGNGSTNFWYFGFGRGVNFNTLTPSSETGYSYPSSTSGGQTAVNEGTASIANACGDRLLYSDGLYAYNRNHEVIPGMSELAFYDGNNDGNNDYDYNDPASYTPSQSGLLLKVPSRNDLYYLFTNPNGGSKGPLKYSVLDLTKEEGLGGIAEGIIDHTNNKTLHTTINGSTPLKNIPISYGGNAASGHVIELLSAIETGDSKGYWVISHGKGGNTTWNSSFLIGKLTVDGIQWSNQNIDPYSGSNFNFRGNSSVGGISFIKFTPAGDQFVVSISTKLYLYDFDRDAGTISNERLLLGPVSSGAIITIPTKNVTGSTRNMTGGSNPRDPFIGCDWISSESGPEFYTYTPTGEEFYSDTDISGLDSGNNENNYLYGIEFSPSGNMLYVSSWGSSGSPQSKNESGIIYQISNFNSLKLGGTPRVETVFMVDNMYTSLTGAPSEHGYSVGSMQIGIDEKIYFTDGGSEYLGVIHRPEQSGVLAQIEPYAVNITNNGINDLLKGEEIEDYERRTMLGLPNYTASNFYNPSISTETQSTLVGNDLTFRVYSLEKYTTVAVDFGDGSPIANIRMVSQTDATAYPLGYEIVVDYNGGTIPTGTSTSFNSWPIELKHTYGSVGEYTVSLYYQRGKSCTDKTRTITVTVTSDDIALYTEHVDKIGEDYATIHGRIPNDDTFDEQITEYGFIYSHTARTDADLVYSSDPDDGINVETKESFAATGTDVSSITGYDATEQKLLYSSGLISLTHRKYVYYRAYAKSNLNTEYRYGAIRRFITEKRDFSLKTTDGFVAVDTESTRNSINNRGTDNSCSFEFWIKRSAEDKDEVIINNTLDGYQLSFDADNKLVFSYIREFTTGSLTSSVSISDSEWHHIAITWNNTTTTTRIYVDGEEDSDAVGSIPEYTAPDNSEMGNLFIGAAGVTSTATIDLPFNGYIDDLRFWNVVLSKDQIQALLYDNIIIDNTTDESSAVTLASRPNISIPGITFANLTASFGFNVESVLSSPSSTISNPFVYIVNTAGLNQDFVHEDSRLNTDYSSLFGYNLVAVGNIASSVVIPRVNWRNNIDGSDLSNTMFWFKSSNWSGFAFPGQGLTEAEVQSTNYEDISESNGVSKVESSFRNCRYTIINSVESGNLKPAVYDDSTVYPEENAVTDYLIDLDPKVNSYDVDVDNNTTLNLEIHGGIQNKINSKTVKVNSGTIVVNSGSVEVP